MGEEVRPCCGRVVSRFSADDDAQRTGRECSDRYGLGQGAGGRGGGTAGPGTLGCPGARGGAGRVSGSTRAVAASDGAEDGPGGEERGARQGVGLVLGHLDDGELRGRGAADRVAVGPATAEADNPEHGVGAGELPEQGGHLGLGIARHGDGAERGAGEPAHDEGRRALEIEVDCSARCDAERPEALRGEPDELGELAVRPRVRVTGAGDEGEERSGATAGDRPGPHRAEVRRGAGGPARCEGFRCGGVECRRRRTHGCRKGRRRGR